MEQSWSSLYIRFAVAPQAESGQHFEECKGFGGRWHGSSDGYPTANYCQPTLGEGVCCGAAAKIWAAVTVAKQSWCPSTGMLGSDLALGCGSSRSSNLETRYQHPVAQQSLWPKLAALRGHPRAAQHSHDLATCPRFPYFPTLPLTRANLCCTQRTRQVPVIHTAAPEMPVRDPPAPSPSVPASPVREH